MGTKLRVNIVSESDISVQGHGVHTAFVEMTQALQARNDVEVIRGEFNRQVECDIVHLHTVGPRVWRKLLQKGPKKVVSAHVVPASFIGSLVGASLWRGVATWYLRWFYNKADLLIAVSAGTAKELQALGIKAPIKVLDNSIDTAPYQRVSEGARQSIRHDLGIDPKAFVVIGAGQVQPRKRIDSFIRAANQCPEMEFIWMGGMPFGRLAADSRGMRQMIDEAPSNVHFPGIVPLEQMSQYYHAADVFWLPSIQETFGLVVVEAAASGLPVVLRDIEDYSETFGPYAVLVDDHTDVAALMKLRDEPTYYATQKKLSAQLAARFDSTTMTDQLVDTYRAIIGN